ncbi:MAG: DALR anticodon-binding domain-containing protein [Clostridia bacterium]
MTKREIRQQTVIHPYHLGEKGYATYRIENETLCLSICPFSEAIEALNEWMQFENALQELLENETPYAELTGNMLTAVRQGKRGCTRIIKYGEEILEKIPRLDDGSKVEENATTAAFLVNSLESNLNANTIWDEFQKLSSEKRGKFRKHAKNAIRIAKKINDIIEKAERNDYDWNDKDMEVIQEVEQIKLQWKLLAFPNAIDDLAEIQEMERLVTALFENSIMYSELGYRRRSVLSKREKDNQKRKQICQKVLKTINKELDFNPYISYLPTKASVILAVVNKKTDEALKVYSLLDENAQKELVEELQKCIYLCEQENHLIQKVRIGL